jgi:preprotein translocase subunit YajC
MEYYDICLVTCCVVLLIELVVAFLIARHEEQEHQKRMENIRKEKEQV